MREIGRTIQADNPRRAITFVDELYERCVTLGENPRAYPLLPNHEEKGIRRRVFGNYLIFYRIGGSAIDVLHVVHGAQEYERMLFGED